MTPGTPLAEKPPGGWQIHATCNKQPAFAGGTDTSVAAKPKDTTTVDDLKVTPLDENASTMLPNMALAADGNSYYTLHPAGNVRRLAVKWSVRDRDMGSLVTEAMRKVGASVRLPEGYRMELVLSDPDIQEPVAIAFDGNGRMYVAEMRTYMQDIDGNNEHDPISRVSRHEDTDGDGTYDRHSTFIDKLVLPRFTG